MSNPQQLILTGDWPSMNQTVTNAKRHWSLYSKEKKTWTDRVWAEAKAGKLRAQTPPVCLRFNWHMVNMKRDPDNLRGVATKYVVDGLAKAGIIPDDSPRYVHSFEDVFVLDRDNPRIVIDLESK